MEEEIVRRAFPNGRCWCLCGEPTGPTVYFAPGHQGRAANDMIIARYGSIPDFLLAHREGAQRGVRPPQPQKAPR